MEDKGKSNWGGHREGAGRPVKSHKKKSLTVWVDDDVRKWIDNQGNKSVYINNLVKNDMK